MLHGRAGELAEIGRLLDDARQGVSGALVLRGEAGIGKTALLEHAATEASDFLVLRCTGVEAEAHLPYAALHLLLHPFLKQLQSLPDPQAAALQGAFGLAVTPGIDPFLVGLATLTLLADLAGDQPLLCLIDDAQWLDGSSSDALLFAGRRLGAEGIAMLVATRDAEGRPARQLVLGALDDDAAAAVLAEQAGDLVPEMQRRLLAESAGNPLALIEFTAALSPQERAGQLPAAPPLAPPGTSRVQDAFAAQAARLPEPTQAALLVASAYGGGDLGVILTAAQRFGAGLADLEPAEAAALIGLWAGVLAFRHPLIRAAVYARASGADRIAAHEALAAVLTGPDHADRRAWHLAAAATGPDDAVADELERAADRAHLRGGYAASSAAYERAARLTTDPVLRARRLAVAADHARDASQLERAVALATEAATLGPGPRTAARIAGIRARVEFERGTPANACEINLGGARAIAGSEPEEAAKMLIEAVRMAYFADRAPAVAEVVPVFESLALPEDHPLRLFAAAGARLARILAGESFETVPPLVHAVRAVPFDRITPPIGKLRLHGASLQLMTGEATQIVRPIEQTMAMARERGMIGGLPHLLLLAAEAALACGRLRPAIEFGTEGLQIAEDTGQEHSATNLRSVLARTAAMTGDEEQCVSYSEASMRYAIAHHTGANVIMAALALCVLDLGRTRYAAAFDRLDRLGAGLVQHPVCSFLTPPEQVEAATRSGRPELGIEPLRRYEAWISRHQDRPVAEAIALRCRALLAEDEEQTDRLFRASLQVHRRADRPLAHARTELLYGEWLRRRHRRTDARDQLRSALHAFQIAGAAPWAERARSELRAAGETATGAEDRHDLLDRLTPQELQVARLAAAGMSNRDIGAQLFLSPRTVGYHLYKTFPKLGISGRGDLARMNLT